MQKSQGPKSTARRRPLRLLSANRTPHPPPPPGSLRRKPPATPYAPAAAATKTPSAPAATNPSASSEPALDRLLLASSDLAGLVSQIDELVSSALHCHKISRRGEQEIESFSAFLSDTNSSLKQWSSRLKQALEASPVRTENAPKQPLEVFPKSAAKGNGQLFPTSSSSSILPQAGPTISPSHNLVRSSSNLPETDLIVSPSPLVSWRTGSYMVESGMQLFLLTPLPKTKACSSRCPRSSKTQLKTTASMDELNLPKSAAKGNGQLFPSSSSILPQAGLTISPSHNLVRSSSNLPETDLIVSPSPLVSWRTGSCMVESGKQLFLLTPLPKTKACLSRCPRSSKTQLKTTASMDELNLPNLPVWKLTISDDNRPDLEQSVKAKEARASAATPQLIEAKKVSSEDSFSFSIQKSRRALPSPCLATALRGRRHVFSPISGGTSKDGIISAGPAESDKPSASSDEMLSDEKDLASRYPDMYGFNLPTGDVRRRRETDEALDWFLSPLKTCVLMDPSPTNDKPIPIPVPAKDNKSLIDSPWEGLESNKLKGRQELSDDNPIQTPAVHIKALLGTPWKGLESTNLKGRHAGETTLKKELWTRFEAVSTHHLHFDKSVFRKSDGRRFIDMLEEES